MEKEITDPLKKEIEAIRPDAVVNIPIGTGYYKKVQELLTYVIKGKSEEDIKRAHEEIKSDAITEEWIKHYQTVAILCKEFETLVKAQKMTETMTVEEFINRTEKD